MADTAVQTAELLPVTHPRRASSIGWLLLPLAFALPWLIEPHPAPWASFYAELAMALLLIPLPLALLMRRPDAWRATALPLGLLMLVLVPLLQAATHRLAYASEGVLAALYLVGLMLSVFSGLQAERLDPGRLGDAMFAGLAIAGLCSVGLQLCQWLGLHGLGAMVLEMPVGERPFANVQQPNLLATLLVWGVIALWWGRERLKIGAVGACAGSGFLLFGIALTQSRAGWLQVGLLGVAAMLMRGWLRRPPARATVIALALWFIALVLLLPLLGAALDAGSGASLADRAAAGKRPAIWRLGLDAIAAKPWLGWGWNQGAAAHVALVARELSIQILIPFFHNLVIDLLLWNGLPLGVLILGAGGAWYVRRWRDAPCSESRLLLLALGTLLVHAMLELPHGYAYFLLPAGLMMGMVDAKSPAPVRLTLPRGVVGAAVVLSALTLAWLTHDYRVVEDDFLALRMRAARVPGQPPPGAAPQSVLLAPLTDVLAAVRIRPAPAMPEADLALLNRAAYRYPSIGNLLRLAHADTLNGRPAQACQALLLLCQMQPSAQCQVAEGEWRRLSAGPDAPAFATVAFPHGSCTQP